MFVLIGFAISQAAGSSGNAVWQMGKLHVTQQNIRALPSPIRALPSPNIRTLGTHTHSSSSSATTYDASL